MSLQQVYSSPSGRFGRRLPATASVRAADELLRRLEPSTSDRIRSPYGESRLKRLPSRNSSANGRIMTPWRCSASLHEKNLPLMSYEPSASLFFAQRPIRPPITRHCFSSGRRRAPQTTGAVDFGSHTLAIWGIPAKMSFRRIHRVNAALRRCRPLFMDASGISSRTLRTPRRFQYSLSAVPRIGF
jgi:hypothetical protein